MSAQLMGIGEAHHEEAGGKNKRGIHAAKWGRPDHSQKQITMTFHEELHLLQSIATLLSLQIPPPQCAT